MKKLLNKIANHYGYYFVTEKNEIDRLIKQDAKRKQAKYDKNIVAIRESLLASNFKHLGFIQDDFVFAEMFGTATRLIYVVGNYDGELLNVLTDINEQNTDRLIEKLITPDTNKFDALRSLDLIANSISGYIEKLTIASRVGETTEYKPLTDEEKKVLKIFEYNLKTIKETILQVREI